MRRAVIWFSGLSLGFRLLISSLATAIPFYFSAYLSYSLTQTATLGGTTELGIHVAVFIVLLTAVVFISLYFISIRNELRDEDQSRIALQLHAYTFVDRLISKSLQTLQFGSDLSDAFIHRFVVSLSDLQDIVTSAYNSFEAAYGKSRGSNNRVDFEVTFMTKSYKDFKITIPASANRDGRAPRSMVLRKQNTDIYDCTVTAIIYNEPRPAIHIVEDTQADKNAYTELYPGQINRIRSSIIYPVLSDTNELLGTLVVHCDKGGFFSKTDEKFWTDVLEIFAKRIAYVKTKMDILAMTYSQGTTDIRVDLPDLFF